MANEAEQRGEDIKGFLRGDHELVKMQFLMELLHKYNYSVESARIEYKRVSQYSGEPTSALCPYEGRNFEHLLKSSNKMKNFRDLGDEIGRSPGDCMIHYYRWKRTSCNEYLPMKMEWKKKLNQEKISEEDHSFVEESLPSSTTTRWVRRSIRPRRNPTSPLSEEAGTADNSNHMDTGEDGPYENTAKKHSRSSELPTLKQTQMRIQETKEQKEKVLKVGDIVYAKYHKNSK